MIDTNSVAISSLPNTNNGTGTAGTTGTASSTSGSSTSTAATNSMNMNQETFLKLLTTQLQYQDPLSPEDPKDFVAQLAQFSTVEQLVNLNSKYDSNNQAIQSLQSSMSMAQGVSFLGKEVKAQGSNFSVTSGQTGNTDFILSGNAQQVTLAISNSAGQVVRTMKLGAMSTGENQVSWDCKDDSGKTVPDGSYSYQVTAVDANGKSVSAATLVSGTVDEVLQDQNKVYLKVNGRLITLDNIISVDQPS